MNRSGVIAGGNWIIDHVKLIDGWPPQDALANIISESWGNGGAPYNVLKNLAKLQAPFPLSGVGLLGQDNNGARILQDCHAHRIETAHLFQTPAAATSYSDVMTDAATGRRTFFHQRGANAHLGPRHFDFTATSAKLFHLGYILLLDQLDLPDPERPEEPQSAGVLRRARGAGLMTLLDCVSENSDRFQVVVRPVLPEVDVLFVSDFEAEKLTGISFRPAPGGGIRRQSVEAAAAALLKMGVQRQVIVHFPEGALALSSARRPCWQPSIAMPSAQIRGTAGAGDAFAAGVILGLHEEWSIADSLRMGVAAAASSLMHPTCSDGIVSSRECQKLAERYGYNPMPV
jgi:sugar/nucleoside kinase (ribokinase family)